MAQSRFEYLHQWSTGIADLARLMLAKLDPAEREAVEEILVRLDDNNHDLETFLNGHGIEVAGFTNLNYGSPPDGNNKWQMQFGRDVKDLATSTHIDFPVAFENGGLLQVTLGDDPGNGATVVPHEASVGPTGFDFRIYDHAGALQTTGLYAINWQLIGW